MRYVAAFVVALLCCLSAIDSVAQKRMVGRVTDENENPMVGALVSVPGTDCKTLTDSEGYYILDVPKEYTNFKVIASFYGYPNDSSDVKPVVDFVMISNRLETLIDISMVNTQKRLQSNREVPIAITALDNSRIDKYNIQDPQELSRHVPGYHNQTQSCVYSVNVIRGVASDGSNSYSFFQPRISVFMDGVSVTHMGTASSDFYDMQRVEVVKGPQGTLFGKGAEFGAISYVSNKPFEKFEARLESSYGSYKQKVLRGMVNTPLNPSTQNRFSFCLNQRDGYNTNLFDGSTISGKGNIQMRNILKHKPSDDLTLMLSIDYTHNDEPSVSYKGMVAPPVPGDYDASPFTPAYFDEPDLFAKRDMGGLNFNIEHQITPDLSYSSTSAMRIYKTSESYDLDGTYLPLIGALEYQNGLQVSQEMRLNWSNHSNLDAFAGVSYMFDRNKHSMRLHSNLQHSFPILVNPTLKTLQQALSLKLKMGLDKGIDDVMSGYRKMLSGQADQLGVLVDALKDNVGALITQRINEKYDELAAQSQWATTPDMFNETVTLIKDILKEEMMKAMAGIILADPSAANLLNYINPDKVIASLGIDNLLTELKQYSNLDLKPDYQENETDINVYHEADLFADASFKITNKLVFTLGIRGTFEHQKTSYFSTSDAGPLVGSFVYHSTDGVTHWLHDNELSWVGRSVLSYTINSRNNMYVSASKGRRPGTVYYNFAVEDAVSLAPETSVSFEIGSKGNMLKNHIMYSLAGYHYDWKHFQSQVMTTGENGIRKYANDDNGKASANGFEASIEAYFGIANAFVDYSYIDASYAKRNTDGGAQMLFGNRFRMTPEHSLDAGFDVKMPIQRTLVWYFRPTYSWMSDMYYSVPNDEALHQKAYGLMDFNVGFNFSINKNNYDLSLYAKNVSDKHYLLDAGCTGQLVGFPTFIMGSPRMVGVDLKVIFR